MVGRRAGGGLRRRGRAAPARGVRDRPREAAAVPRMSAGRPQAGLKARLVAGETLIGAFANLGSPLAVEALAIAGLDWVLVDLEHGGGHEAALMGQIHGAAAGGAALLVRVEAGERPRIQRAL